MEKIFIFFFLLPIVYSFPCPPECICKPIASNDIEFTRMSYIIDCSNISLNNDKLIYQADSWSIQEDKLNDDDDSTNDYVISIDLSNSLSLKEFTDKTIQLSGFSYLIQSLSLTSQSKNFILNSKAFNSTLYENLQILNLSSCCKQIPKECPQLFRPLRNLQILDLSGSDMYKSCLGKPDTISTTVNNLILRNNLYDANTFSHTSLLFDGIRLISGKLDLQNSLFKMGSQLEGNCLFDLFEQIISLDMSSVQFESISNDTEIHITHLLKCKIQADGTRRGEKLVSLQLRQLKLQRLPEWFTSDRFPLLKELDLSNNNIYSIDLSTYLNLRYISLGSNPIELEKIVWRADTIYQLINLRSTTQNRTFNLTRRLKNLFKLATNIDYSDNKGKSLSDLTTANIPILDIQSIQFSLNISRTNIRSFQSNWNDLRRLDISSNSLTELNLAEQMKLNYLDCSNQILLNKLILNQDLTDLTELKCSNNSLITIENFSLLKNEQLRLIDLSNNLISSIKDLFQNLNSRYLYSINLKSNSIQIIPKNIFHQKLISLYEINLSWNQIHTIQKNAIQAPNLQILDLTGNPLKNIEPKAIVTASLRLFFIFNNTQQLNDRCAQSASNDTLLSVYFNWFDQHGTFTEKKQILRNKQVRSNKCLARYMSPTKKDWIISKGKHVFGFYALYIILGTCLIGLIFGGIRCYRNNKARFQRYKQLDRSSLVENAAEMGQQTREDDEIVMNLHEPPFNRIKSEPTEV